MEGPGAKEETPLDTWLPRPVRDQADTLQTRLLRAATDGCSETVRDLLRASADPARLDACGASPVHAAAYFGRIQVLEALLEAKSAEACGLVDAQSSDGLGHWRRVRGGRGQVMRLRPLEDGQLHLPVHCFSGRTPLMFAVEGAQATAVAWLLERGCNSLLMDVHERSAAELAEERWSIASLEQTFQGHKAFLSSSKKLPTGPEQVAAALSVQQLLQGRAQDLSDKALRSFGEAARAAVRHREVQLVERLQAKEAKRRADAVDAGLEIVAELYRPLHNCVYSRLCIDAARALPPSPSFVEERAPGVLVFPFLAAEFCKKVWEELHHYEQQASELALPLHERFDLNISQLERCGFRPLLEVLNDGVQPLLARLGLDPPVTQVGHAVRLHNYVGRPGSEKLALKVHQDKYRLTLNICLHATNDLEGSSVSFFRPPTEAVELKVGAVYTPDQADIIYSHVHQVGDAVLHSSKNWHRTDPILAGERGSLILWCE